MLPHFYPWGSPVDARGNLAFASSWTGRLLLAVGLVLAAGSCQTYQPKAALGKYAAGNFEGAYDEIADPPWWRGKRKHDKLIWLFEEAKVLRDLGRYEESSEVFDQALKLFEEYEFLRADFSVTDELKGLVSQVLRPFKGSFSDAIMAASLLALNDMAVGNLSNARNATIQALEWQNEAKLRFQEELERADQLAEKEEIDRNQLMEAEGLQGELETIDSYTTEGHADYLNPFASFVAGITSYAHKDVAEAKLALEEVAGMVPANSYVRGLLQGSIPANDGTVYLLYERGMAPARQEFRVAFPTPNGFFTVAIPVLRPQPDPASCLRITDDAGALDIRTEHLANIDSIVATQFRHDLPGIIVRTVISAVAKEVGSKAVKDAVRNQSVQVRAFAWLGTLFFKTASSGADLRTWRTIGSEYQVAVFQLPESGSFNVQLLDASGQIAASERVEVPQSPLTVVTARSIGLHVLRIAPPITTDLEP